MFCNLAKVIFEYFCDNRRILATFAKFFSNRFSQIIPLPESQARFPRFHASFSCSLIRQIFTKSLLTHQETQKGMFFNQRGCIYFPPWLCQNYFCSYYQDSNRYTRFMWMYMQLLRLKPGKGKALKQLQQCILIFNFNF